MNLDYTIIKIGSPKEWVEAAERLRQEGYKVWPRWFEMGFCGNYQYPRGIRVTTKEEYPNHNAWDYYPDSPYKNNYTFVNYISLDHINLDEKGTTTMENLYLNDHLDKETRLLVKLGYLDSTLQPTDKAHKIMQHSLYQLAKDAVLAAAKEEEKTLAK